MKKADFREVPQFNDEDEEREFWATHGSTDYFDWTRAKIGVFPNLKSSQKKDLE